MIKPQCRLGHFNIGRDIPCMYMYTYTNILNSMVSLEDTTHSRFALWEFINPENHLFQICGVWIDLKNFVHQVSRITDVVQRRLKVIDLTNPT